MDFFIQSLIAQHPGVLKLLVYVAIARGIFKPLSIALQAYVDSSESTKDNEFYSKLKENKVFKAIYFILDYSSSIKLPK